jgi:hypothetical protein
LVWRVVVLGSRGKNPKFGKPKVQFSSTRYRPIVRNSKMSLFWKRNWERKLSWDFENNFKWSDGPFLLSNNKLSPQFCMNLTNFITISCIQFCDLLTEFPSILRKFSSQQFHQ